MLTAFGYRWGQLMAYAMYDTLVKYDKNGRAVPLLAKSWSTPNAEDDDREDPARASSSTTATRMRVEDVVWSLNRIHDPVKPASNNFLALPKDIWGKAVKVDNQTLRITTKKPTRMIESWRFWFIMPENADDLNLGEQPIGTGPFQYKNFVKGDRLDLERVPRLLERQPAVPDELTFRFLADEAAQVANFLSGDVDYLHDISVATLPQVDGKRNSKLIPSGHLLPVVAAADVLRPAQGRPKVRLALQWAFDKDDRQQGRLGWTCRPDLEPVREEPVLDRQGVAGRRPRSEVRPGEGEEPARAAGAVEPEAEHDDPQGSGPWTREAPVLQQGFKKAGINATIQVLPAAQWFDRLYTKRNHDGHRCERRLACRSRGP